MVPPLTLLPAAPYHRYCRGSSNNQAPDVKVGAIILGDETEGYSAAHINGIKAAAELGMSDDQIV